MEEPVNYREMSACFGKERFSTKSLANTAHKRIEKRRRKPKYKGAHTGQVVAYRCPHCQGFHLGRDEHAKR